MMDASEQLRRVAFGVGYRMLGSVADAEDIAQESLARLLASGDAPANAEAWVTTVATRLSIDQLRSARRQREQYFGEWLPEPLVDGGAERATDASGHAELADDLSLAFLVLLETLSPTERAAFLLHDVFDFSYGETARALERPSEASVRQLVSRARARISERMPRYEVSSDEQSRLVDRFIAACEQGEVAPFVELLAADVVFTGDGGGKVPPGFAISRPVRGLQAVAKVFASFSRRAVFPAHLEAASIGGAPGVVVIADLPRGGGLMGVLGFAMRAGRIAEIDGVVNPEKLGHLAGVYGGLADYSVVSRL
ncbi:RNA polymerase sigma factor SigJ [Gryllotalpicola protaetiae]|uniref:Sigma-70 family RNA polymerase sigma factor n=1 Tax=Gryllotalpicola protaetiae TaxID=2419771 RepID=A0A387BK97_9MICO|nr:RNA polymerase sigma factor SigJ [Gryllotalpicola protaetiae]AYG02722.1 sigma-70 family RNA polymerase sigma factor [Gryllotalpicola protaetiae]